jgi:uncharacterized protein (TIGR03067 family)
MKKCVLGVLVIGLLIAADDKKDDAKKDDAKDKLKGTWTMVSLERSGQKVSEDEWKGNSLTFEGDNVSYKTKADTKKGTFRYDDSQKPAALDITPTEGPDKGKTMKMIVMMDGDNLKIAGGNGPDAPRPKGFDDKGIVVITLTREKK